MDEKRRSHWKAVVLGELAKAPTPPTKLTVRLGAGMHLLLSRDGVPPLHVRLLPRRPELRGWYEGRFTVGRYTGADDLPDVARDWLDRIAVGLDRAEAGEGWADFLEGAAALPDVSVGKERPDERMTSGSSVLVRIHEPCNAACDFCSCIGVMPDYAVTMAQIEAELRVARERGDDGVTFTGGEPTLRRDLVDVVRLAASMGFRDVSLQTNAVKLADRDRVRALVDAGLTSVFVSLHAATPALHDALLKLPGAFDAAVAAIDHLVEAGVMVRVNHVVQRDNLAGVPAFARLLADRWGRGVQVTWSFVSPLGRTLEHLDLLPRLSDAVPLLREALDTCRAAGIDADVPGLCGVPMCQLPEHLESFAEFRDTVPPPRLETRAYAEACARCELRSRCSGYWKVYVDRYGADELHALTAPGPLG